MLVLYRIEHGAILHKGSEAFPATRNDSVLQKFHTIEVKQHSSFSTLTNE